MTDKENLTDLSLARIAAAAETPIGSFKGRGTWLLAEHLDPQQLIHQILNVEVEPAGAAGVAALVRHGSRLDPGRTAVLLTGASTNEPPP